MDYPNLQPTSGGLRYDSGFPAAVTDPDSHITTQPDVPFEDPGDWPGANVQFSTYIHASEGGVSGSNDRLGWTTGIAKLDRNVHHFTGRAVRFVRRNLANDNNGPVGSDHYQDKLAYGVENQFVDPMPPLEEIYRSIVGGY